MKVYACPKEVVLEEPDYKNYDRVKEQAKEDAHMAALKAYLLAHGYTGKHTGDVYKTQIADGYACYMFADGGAKSVLIHLPYGDAYNSRDVQYLPKAEVLKRIEADKKMAALFAARPQLKTT